jgi:phosphonate transport system substrate-binding protein
MNSIVPAGVARAAAAAAGAGRRLALPVLALGLMLSGSGCERASVAVDPSERPALVLRLGYTPSEDVLADREEAQQTLADYLTRELHLKVERVRTTSYGPAVEAMERGEIDVMSLGPFAYVLAARRGVAEAVAVTGWRDRGPRTYQSAIITHRRTGLKRLDDVPAVAKQLRFNYTDPASNSGHLVPQTRLAAAGLQAEQHFSSVEYTLSHSVAIFNVLHDKADLAGVSASVLERLGAKRRFAMDDLVVLWRSESFPLGPVTVRSSLPTELKRELQRALVELPVRDPQAARVVMAQYSESGLVYLACDPSLYEGLQALAESIR